MPSPFEDPGYRYATVKYAGDGTTVDFEFSFAGGYISKDHIMLALRSPFTYVWDEQAVEPENYTIVGTNQVHLEGNFRVPVGKTLVIRRWTPKDIPLQNYQDGAILNEYNLNQSTQQAIFSVAEMVDLFWEMISIFWEVLGDYDDLVALVNDLLARVVILENQMLDMYQWRGDINNTIADIIDRLEALENAGFITDSPQDGTIYGRQDGSWVAVPDDGIEEAPQDGSTYGRQDGAWVAVEDTGIEEAPQDGNTYGRQDGSWVAVPDDGIEEAPQDGKLYGRQSGSWAEVLEVDVQDIIDQVLELTKVRTLEVSVAGLFDITDEEIFRLPIPEACTATWPDNATNAGPIRASLAVAPTAAWALTVRKNGTQIGKINFAASATSGSWDNTGTDEVSFAAGDRITITVDAADDTASGLGVSMTGIVID